MSYFDNASLFDSDSCQVSCRFPNLVTPCGFSKGLGRHGGDIHPVTLRFRDKKLEKEYESLRDSSFKFYIVCAFVIFLFMVAVQILILAK